MERKLQEHRQELQRLRQKVAIDLKQLNHDSMLRKEVKQVRKGRGRGCGTALALTPTDGSMDTINFNELGLPFQECQFLMPPNHTHQI